MSDQPDVLLVGAGDLGTEIGLRLAARDHGVVAVRRRAELLTTPLIGMAGDLEHGLPELPYFAGVGGGPRLLVVCLTPTSRDADGYRRIFLDAVGRVLDEVRDRGWAPERALFVSSTSVCAPAGRIHEETTPDPQTESARVLLDAERAFIVGVPSATTATVVRLSGLYGPGRGWFVDQVRQGRVSDPVRITHRVHRDDAAAAVAHLLTMDATPEQLYLVTDDAPVRAGEVAAHITHELGLAQESGPPSGTKIDEGARILRNERLRATGFRFAYPSYREGYSAVLAGLGVRHP